MKAPQPNDEGLRLWLTEFILCHVLLSEKTLSQIVDGIAEAVSGRIEAAVLAGKIDLIRELNGEGDVHWSITDGRLRALQAEQVKLTRKDGEG